MNDLNPCPNLIIMGAQKSGTTSLYEYLKVHPDIFMSSPVKEPGFYLGDERAKIFWERNGNPISSRRELLQERMLKGYQGERWFGDASTYYTIGQRSQLFDIPQRMHATNPDMRFIYVLRDPIERVMSNYRHSLKKQRYEGSFEGYLTTNEGKTALLTSQYYRQLSAYTELFDLSQFKFIIFEDLVANPAQQIDDICAFLHIAPPPVSDVYKKFNVSPNIGEEISDTHRRIVGEHLLEDAEKIQALLGGPVATWSTLNPDLKSSSRHSDRPEIPSDLIQAGGFLFLKGGNHDVVDLFTGRYEPAPGSAENFTHNQRIRHSYCAAKGIPCKSIVFPEKIIALSKHLPFETFSVFERYYAHASRELNTPAPLYPLTELSTGYPRTDTHLNLQGITTVVRLLLGDMAPKALTTYQQVIEERKVLKHDFCGDLGRKLATKPSETVEQCRPAQSVQMTNNGMASGNDGLLILAENKNAQTDKTLLIYGDSYFRQLLPHLAFFFRSIVFARTRFFHQHLADEIRPDCIFFGMAERYLSRCEPDDNAPNFFAYPLIKARAIDPQPEFSATFKRIFNIAQL